MLDFHSTLPNSDAQLIDWNQMVTQVILIK